LEQEAIVAGGGPQAVGDFALQQVG